MAEIARQQAQSSPSDWLELPHSGWADTCASLHLWTQVVGKIRVTQAPMVNHWWRVPLYLTCGVLTTSPLPYGGKSFQINFDFNHHVLKLQTSKGEVETIDLGPRTMADFYTELMGRLRRLGLAPQTMPVEIPEAIPFEQDKSHASYDPGYVTRFWQILVQVDRVFNQFRGLFLGKAGPVHLFWDSFDMAVTRLSGRTAPPLSGSTPNVGAGVTHEVSSCGFWPRSSGFGKPAFYSCAYPEPQGFA